uniref:Floricaula/leafy-like transcription factor n=1 Tax=Anemia villosa TaxID=148560 RepID=A0A8E7II71_9MONI|nr:LEAFY 1 [Anemia villosa]
MFRWEQQRAGAAVSCKEPQALDMAAMAVAAPINQKQLKSLEDLFKDYGVRTATTMGVLEMGFTVSTLVSMTEKEVDEVIKTMVEGLHMDLLVGERYGMKSALRAERRRREEEVERQRLQLVASVNAKKQNPDDSCVVGATSMEAGNIMGR